MKKVLRKWQNRTHIYIEGHLSEVYALNHDKLIGILKEEA